MSRATYTFRSIDGKTAVMESGELEFLVAPFNRANMRYGFYWAARAARRAAIVPVLLFLKGFVCKMMKCDPPLPPPEFYSAWSGFMGFEPATVTFKNEQVSFSLGCSHTSFFTSILFIREVAEKNQYMLSKSNVSGKVVIDAGANIGAFSIFAAKMGAKKVYAFEPVKETFLQLRKNIRLNKLQNVIVPLNMALGEKPGQGTIHYAFGCDGGATLVSKRKVSWQNKSHMVPITTIDRFMQGKGKLGFLKMDTEGYEEKILLGAKKTLAKYKPILAFSAYHNPDDKTKLPLVIKRIRGDYRCTLHRYCEEDLYCE